MVNAAAKCDPMERQGSSIQDVVCWMLVTVCDKFQIVRCSQSVVSYGWEKVWFKVCCKSWITNNALTWNFVSNCKKSAKETHDMLKLVYVDAAVAMKTVYMWLERFRNGCESVEDEERSGRPWTSKTQENVERVSEMIRSKRRLTIREIYEDLNISYGSVQNILTTDLNIMTTLRVTHRFWYGNFCQIKILRCVLIHLTHRIWHRATSGSSPKSKWPWQVNVLNRFRPSRQPRRSN